MYASISSSLAALASGLQARAPRRPHGRSHGDRRPCCARASSAQTDAAEPPRRGVLLAASSAVAAALSGAPQAAVAAYGTVNSGGGTAASNESAFTTFYGAANPPATYGALGGTSPDKAKYSYVVPSTWVEEATSKASDARMHTMHPHLNPSRPVSIQRGIHPPTQYQSSSISIISLP